MYLLKDKDNILYKNKGLLKKVKATNLLASLLVIVLLSSISFNIKTLEGVPDIIDKIKAFKELPLVLNNLLNGLLNNLEIGFNKLKLIIISFKINIINKEGKTLYNHKLTPSIIEEEII